MKTKHILPASERKALWVDAETYILVRHFANKHGLSIAYATFLLLGKALVEIHGGDFSRSRFAEDMAR